MKSKVKFVAIILAIAIINLEGCGKPGKQEVLARIDQKYTITLRDFNDRISKLPERYQDVINKNKKAFLDELVVDLLLYNEAKRKKLDKDEDVQKIFAEARKKIMIARLLKDEVEDRITVSEEEIENYYNANPEKFTTPQILRASHILVKTEKEAREILAELSNGRDFEDLARSRSIDPTSKVGGDIGYFTRHQLVPEIEEVCFGMEVGDISEIVKTKFGFHVVKLTEKKEPEVKPLEDVRGNIEQFLKRLKKKNLFNNFVESLRERAKITINNDLLETISEEESQKPESQ